VDDALALKKLLSTKIIISPTLGSELLLLLYSIIMPPLRGFEKMFYQYDEQSGHFTPAFSDRTSVCFMDYSPTTPWGLGPDRVGQCLVLGAALEKKLKRQC